MKVIAAAVLIQVVFDSTRSICTFYLREEYKYLYSLYIFLEESHLLHYGMSSIASCLSVNVIGL